MLVKTLHNENIQWPLDIHDVRYVFTDFIVDDYHPYSVFVHPVLFVSKLSCFIYQQDSLFSEETSGVWPVTHFSSHDFEHVMWWKVGWKEVWPVRTLRIVFFVWKFNAFCKTRQSFIITLITLSRYNVTVTTVMITAMSQMRRRRYKWYEYVWNFWWWGV